MGGVEAAGVVDGGDDHLVDAANVPRSQWRILYSVDAVNRTRQPEQQSRNHRTRRSRRTGRALGAELGAGPGAGLGAGLTPGRWHHVVINIGEYVPPHPSHHPSPNGRGAGGGARGARRLAHAGGGARTAVRKKDSNNLISHINIRRGAY
jgi:hypothetical protein